MLANHDRVAGVALMALSGSAFFYAQRFFPDEPAMYPKLICGLMFLLSFALFGRSFLAGYRDKEFGKFAIHFPRLCLAVFMTGAYFLAAELVGFFTATVCVVPGMAYAAGYRAIRGLAVGTVCYLIFIFVVFIWIFNRPLTPELLLKLVS